MKKIFFTCCIAISALAITSANTNKQQSFYNRYSVKDTVPNTLDTMHNNWNSDTMHQNSMDTSMNMRRDSTSPAPPHK